MPCEDFIAMFLSKIALCEWARNVALSINIKNHKWGALTISCETARFVQSIDHQMPFSNSSGISCTTWCDGHFRLVGIRLTVPLSPSGQLVRKFRIGRPFTKARKQLVDLNDTLGKVIQPDAPDVFELVTGPFLRCYKFLFLQVDHDAASCLTSADTKDVIPVASRKPRRHIRLVIISGGHEFATRPLLNPCDARQRCTDFHDFRVARFLEAKVDGSLDLVQIDRPSISQSEDACLESRICWHLFVHPDGMLATCDKDLPHRGRVPHLQGVKIGPSCGLQLQPSFVRNQGERRLR